MFVRACGGGGGGGSSDFSGMWISNCNFMPPDERYLIPHFSACMCVVAHGGNLKAVVPWKFALVTPPSETDKDIWAAKMSWNMMMKYLIKHPFVLFEAEQKR